jgi:hypothetical protein
LCDDVIGSTHHASAGSLDELNAEMGRLTELLSLMKSLDASHGLSEPSESAAQSDRELAWLRLVLAWRRQRRGAIELEIERLKKAVVVAEEERLEGEDGEEAKEEL